MIQSAAVATARKTRRRRRRGAVALAAAAALLAWAGCECSHLPDVRSVATRNPASTALIEHRAQEAKAKGLKARRHQIWEPLTALSPQLVDAVLASEDARFYQHHGVDTDEMGNALRAAWKRRALGRGASTITQQLAKNLWLSGDRSLIRKGKELVLALRLESALNKPRILTLYMNVAEWGDGVYGAEAAAQEYFGVPASELSLAQSAILAAMLPAPRKRTPGSHSPALQQRALWIVDQLVEGAKIPASEGEPARQEIRRILGTSEAEDVDEPDE